MKLSIPTFILLISLLGCNASSNEAEIKEPTIPDKSTISNLQISYAIETINPYTVKFQAKVTSNVKPSELVYSWDFGDGTQILGKEEELHSFEPNQQYQITLKVSDGGQVSKTKTTHLTTDITHVATDEGTHFQTIKGFGGFGAMKPWWFDGPFFDQPFIDRLVHDLGVTIIRDNVPEGFEYINDNDDPFSLSLENFNIDQDHPNIDSCLGQHLPYLKAMKEAGVETFIASIWSPPAWMKHNNALGNGTQNETSAPPYTATPDQTSNQLKTENYEEFAEMCVAYIKLLKQETGIDLYALSLQNEPRFSQFYASTVYDFNALRDLIKVVGKRFEAENIDTKLFMPEDVQSMFHIQGYIQAILNDSEARKYVDIIAIHNYALDGITASDEGPSNWENTFELAKQNQSEVWMTETSGFNDSWDGAFDLALSMYNALNYGNASAWVFWQMSDGGNLPLISNGTPTDKYYTSKNFYKYIRPGAIRLSTNVDSEHILALAFLNTNGKKTMVLYNTFDSDRVIELTGDFRMEQFVSYLNGKDAVEVIGPEFLGGDGFILPSRSIVTFHQL